MRDDYWGRRAKAKYVEPDQTQQNTASDQCLSSLFVTLPTVLDTSTGSKTLVKSSGPSCSKLMTSLVNDPLKFTSKDTRIC